MPKVMQLLNPFGDIYTRLRAEGGPIDNFATFAGYLNSGAEIPEREREMIKNIFFPSAWDAFRSIWNPAAVEQVVSNKLKAAEMFAKGAVNMDLLPPEERAQLGELMATWEQRRQRKPPASKSAPRDIPYEEAVRRGKF